MTNEIERIINGDREIEQFDPTRHRLTIAALDYGIKEAKRIKDWPILEKAVDAKIDELRAFVAWWKANIRGAGGNEAQAIAREHGRMVRSEAEKLTGMDNRRVSELGKALQKLDQFRDALLGAEYRAAYLTAIDNVRGTQGTGDNEWFTPKEYIDCARAVLGEIDLDPATHEQAQKVVQASEYFTREDDGLAQEWHGRVWLNPPYGQPLIAQFVSKMVSERLASHVTAAIMLTNNYTDTSWFHEAMTIADAVCFTRGRIKWVDPDGGPVGIPTQGQAFCYFGSDVRKFADRFRDVGFIVRPYGLDP